MSSEKELTYDDYIPVAQEVKLDLDHLYKEKVRKIKESKKVQQDLEIEYEKELKNKRFLMIEEAYNIITKGLLDNNNSIKFKEFKKHVETVYELKTSKKIYFSDNEMIIEAFREAAKKFMTDKVYLYVYAKRKYRKNYPWFYSDDTYINFSIEKRSTCIVS